MFEELRRRVCAANLALETHGLVVQTWGNASAIDRQHDIVGIKPSGVDYASLQPEQITLVNLQGEVVDGPWKPSVDLHSHLELYRALPGVGGVIHTHSHYATCFAQARREIPCFGTTHADYFYGAIPVIAPPGPEQAQNAYERHTGAVIAQYLRDADPMRVPAVIIAGHGPFVWGESVEKAIENAVVLEHLARMAFHTLALNPDADTLEDYLLDKHFMRKHGQDAYYGQTPSSGNVP